MNNSIVAIDAVSSDKKINLKFVKSTLFQEGKIMLERNCDGFELLQDTILVIWSENRRNSSFQRFSCAGHINHALRNSRFCRWLYLGLVDHQKANFTSSKQSSTHDWIIIIVAAVHKLFSKRRVPNFTQKFLLKYRMRNSLSVPAQNYRDVKLVTLAENEELLCSFWSLLYVPDSKYKLFSSKMTGELDFDSVFKDKVHEFKKPYISLQNGPSKLDFISSAWVSPVNQMVKTKHFCGYVSVAS